MGINDYIEGTPAYC